MAKVTGGIYIPHLKEHIVTPTLNYIGLGGSRAINLVTGTFLAEGYAGGYTYLKQIKGPAVGAMQMEPATYNDIWKNFLSSSKRANLVTYLKQLAGDWNTDANGIPLPSVMTGGVFFAAAMCRVHYLRVPDAIPEATDAQALSNYHKKYYNTSVGKADPVANKDRFQQAIEA